MVKYYDNTMNLVNAKSEFELKKGNKALIIKSFDMHVVIIPEDSFSGILLGSNLNRVNIDGLIQLIGNLLIEKEPETGGILSIKQIFSILKNSSIKNVFEMNHLKKTIKLMKNTKNIPYELIFENDIQYFSLKPSESSLDKSMLLKIAQKNSFLTESIIHSELGWSDLRIRRILKYLISEKQCRKDSSYRAGTRYFFFF